MEPNKLLKSVTISQDGY
ncbi:MAG: hypothetical protein EWV53_17150 [Microcystis panniformis Mp_MB_F_20051200_S9]|uniref:Histone H2A C-terminal domain-containing protein n=1 Tax=Microcystis panniformis Mp_MB_F_20051200_S9 TaxID=2486223 RepID=A0A552PQP7_9CHRO|nr:MAG: hypothetical protein EWV87_20355 [Microcystis panniformis Mp_GB_SS_20050300_S99]TRV46236.1 MAG: hypothetical protein EWV42_18610 [Microcystis panniformis Mp_GB_SS_20050300_S99D]TRV52493.1 MAG: hypothetical protein EWV43_02120 [Microcystis panniformis Mp_MB_F_20080800_S26D]TRV58363.1 MAG: hypothetical protein EWV69_14095 [Microcystis panniformis Mp_MB_F_20080800_S26]TRV59282.1 MAG: hypothetical protein EWV53_17150 [Microcystis panniformis Mp_MB_F_20051200_S9]TRV61141.1 MAG: hypothetical